MTNYQKFIAQVASIAKINHVISSLESIGLGIDDASFDGALYGSFDGLATVAMDFLDLDNIDTSTSNKIYNKLICAEIENGKQLAEDLWNEYGAK